MVDVKELATNYFILQRKLSTSHQHSFPSLSKGEMAMLGYFVYEKDESTPTELSEYLNLSTARVANTLNSLEKKEYVERIHDTKDRRRVTVHVTDTGKEYFLGEEKNAMDEFSRLIEILGEKDAEHLNRIIAKLKNNLPY